MLIIAVLPLLIWIGLLLFRGQFWRADQRLPRHAAPAAWPSVAVVIPARNESETIGQVVAAHMRSDYRGQVAVWLVDDSSDDGTADVARAAADNAGDGHVLNIVSAPPLPEGWSGKLWAVHNGVKAASETRPDYILLTDADIVHGPALLTRLIARAEAEDEALVSIMSRLDDRGVWGGLLIPAFIFFFQKLYPFPQINDPVSKMAGAAGGVALVRRDALEEIGGIESLRDALIDDCTLAQRMKHGPPHRPISLFLADAFADARSLRDNRSYGSVAHMVARTAFAQLNYSSLQLAGALLGMVLVYLAGPVLALSWPLHGNSPAGALGLATWFLMIVAYAPTLRAYGRGSWYGVALPVAAALYTSFTWLSAWRYWRGRGGQWKGRTYPATGAGISPSSASHANDASSASSSDPGSNPST